MNTILPYKDRRSRGGILWLWILMLFLLNGFFVVMIKFPDFILPYVLLLCILWAVYRLKRRDFSKLRYRYDEKKIEVIRWNKLLKSFNKSDILTIEHNQSLPWFSLKYLRFPRIWIRWTYTNGTMYHARLSLTNLSKITLKNYDEIRLSGTILEN